MKPCPKCSNGSVEISRVLASKPLGSYSIAGAQTKIVAQERFVASCTSCDLKVVGHLENAVVNEQGVYTGGHFVEDRV